MRLYKLLKELEDQGFAAAKGAGKCAERVQQEIFDTDPKEITALVSSGFFSEEKNKRKSEKEEKIPKQKKLKVKKK